MNAADVDRAFLLTGGGSRRMGADKASLNIHGVPMGLKIARAIAALDIPVTVLGREPLPGFDFLPDSTEFCGPLKVLAGARPPATAAFVCACDLPLFDSRLIALLAGLRAEHDAAVPHVDSRPQPLCAVYGVEAFARLSHLSQRGSSTLMDWLEALRVRYVTEREVSAAGIDPRCALGANTPEELDRLLGRSDARDEESPEGRRD